MATIAEHYRTIRESGGVPFHQYGQAVDSWDAAQVLTQWDEMAARGLVRVRKEPDPHFDWSEMKECGTPDDIRKWKRLGAWGTLSEYRPHVGAEWIESDACWGHAGYPRADILDPLKNCYVLDEMRQALADLRDACPLLFFRESFPGAD